MEEHDRTRKCRHRKRGSRPSVYLVVAAAALLLVGFGFLLGRCSAEGAGRGRTNEHDVVCYGGKSNAAGNLEPTEDKKGTDLPWYLRLVNADHPLEEQDPPELTELQNGQAVDARIYESLQRMMDAARADGVEPVICSSYRARKRQKELFEDKCRRLREDGCNPSQVVAAAAEWVAQPGTSEHELGLALDIVDKSYQMLDEKQEDTPAQQWLLAHSWEYGFVLRYPTDRAKVTGVEYEPWHYRYVGKEAAEAMNQDHLCLEEYLSAVYGVH